MYNKLRVFVGACIGMFFFGVAFLVMGAMLPLLTAKYQFSAEQTASLVTAIPVGVIIGSLIFGPIVDRFGYRSLIIISILMCALGFEGLAFFPSLAALWCSSFVIGFGGGMLSGCTNSLVSEISDDKNRIAWLGILGSCFGVGALVIPTLLGVLMEIYSFETIIQWSGVVIATSVVYFFLIRFPASQYSGGIPVKKMLQLTKQPLMLILSACLFFECALEGVVNNWTTSYLTDVSSITEPQVMFSLTMMVVGLTLGRLLLPFIDRLLDNVAILIGSLLLIGGGACMLIWAMDYSYIMTYAAMMIIGIGLASGFPVIVGILGTYFKEMTGTAMGLAMFIAQIGTSLSVYGMGQMSNFIGIGSFPFYIITLVTIQTIIIISNKSIINTKHI